MGLLKEILMNLREHIITEGYARVFDVADRKALFTVATELKNEGHAVVLEESSIDGRVTSATAHHYRTCIVCYQERNGVHQ